MFYQFKTVWFLLKASYTNAPYHIWQGSKDIILTLACQFFIRYEVFVGVSPSSYFTTVHLEGFADKQNLQVDCSVEKAVYSLLYNTWPLKVYFRSAAEKSLRKIYFGTMKRSGVDTYWLLSHFKW